MRRRAVLVGVGLVAIAFVVFGLYALRNTFTDHLAFVYFGRGTQLSKLDADKLEQDLKSDPNSFADRIVFMKDGRVV